MGPVDQTGPLACPHAEVPRAFLAGEALRQEIQTEQRWGR